MQKLEQAEGAKFLQATNGHEIRMVGMSRSGNHAIINWMLAQMPGRKCYLNCVEPRTNPFHSARPVQGRSWRANYPLEIEVERAGRFSRKDFLIYNYEDCFLGLIDCTAYEHARDTYVGASRRRSDVLVLRDPYNLFASRKRGIHSPVPPHTAVRIWKQHARAALGRSRFMSSNLVVILYNRWVCDRDYRASVAAAIGFPFTDAGRNRVATAGGGSSFDRLQYDGAAERMDVFRRWLHYAEDEAYKRSFDPEVVQLCREVFSALPEDAARPLEEAVEALGLWSGEAVKPAA